MSNNKTLSLNKETEQNNAAAQDERFARSSAPEVRGDRGSQEDAARTSDPGQLSADEFQKFLETESLGTRLPRPPVIPGWHTCWLTTTSQYDTIQNRMRFGYQLVRQSELPGFDPSNGQNLVGHEGTVTCNEMVLGKIREERYQQMMAYFHHQKPLEDETGLASRINQASKDSSGRQLVTTDGDGDIDGINDMEATARAASGKTPTFSE